MVAVFGIDPVFLLADVRAYINEGTALRGAEGELTDTVLGMSELAEVLGVDRVAADGNQRRQAWHLIPPPDGHVGTAGYWLAESVQRWRADKPKRNRRNRRNQADRPS